MPDDDTVRVAVFYVDDDERREAEAALGDSVVYANVVEGTMRAGEVEPLAERGLVVERLPAATPPAGPGWDDDQAAVVSHMAEMVPPDQEPERPGGDFCWVRLRGPITRDQRLQLDAIGVDIAAFEPPDRYRTFLTDEQRPQVEGFDFVVAVVPYVFEEKLTPEIVELAAQQQTAAVEPVEPVEPELAGEGAAGAVEATGHREVFDCLLHRERDLVGVRDAIGALPGAEVLGTSNLRIRFAAPADMGMLSHVARRPEVRKLDVYRPPET